VSLARPAALCPAGSRRRSFTGAGAGAFLESLVPTSISKLEPYSSSLSVLLNAQGGIVDDTVITKHSDERYYVVTNAGRRTEDLKLFADALKAWQGAKLEHEVLENWGLVALQGAYGWSATGAAG
jgi:aminomethyltransferase